MSSPQHHNIQLDSSESESSEEHSSSLANNNRKKKRRTHRKTNDRFLISAHQWTPIVGAPVPKPTTTNHQDINNNTSKLVFQPTSITLSPKSQPSHDRAHHHTSDLESPEPILLSPQEKVTLYVDCFEEMLNTVLKHEAFLFLHSELKILSSWQALPRES